MSFGLRPEDPDHPEQFPVEDSELLLVVWNPECGVVRQTVGFCVEASEDWVKLAQTSETESQCEDDFSTPKGITLIPMEKVIRVFASPKIRRWKVRFKRDV